MPVWPDFSANSKPMRTSAKQSRPPARLDRGAMLALVQWHHWRRQRSAQASRAVRVVDDVIRELDQRKQQAVDAWLAGSRDRDIGEGLGMPVPLIAKIGFDVLAQVAECLAEPKARNPRPLPDRDALDAQLRELGARLLAGGKPDLGDTLSGLNPAP